MADISPICSIMEARAIGAITKIAEILNLQIENSGTPTHAADAIFVKSRIAEPSAFVIPSALKISAAA